MKNKFLPAVFATVLALVMSSFAQKDKTLSKVLTLSIPDGDGYNGACVAYHPGKKLYYAAMAGNKVYPMTIFDPRGTVVSEGNECGFDVRGLWYNGKTGQLEGNAYAEGGWYSYNLDTRGITGSVNHLFTGQNQPTEQSVGAFAEAKNQIWFYSEGEVFKYNRSNGKSAGKIKLKSNDLSPYNSTAMICTGIKNKEIGLYNSVNHCVDFYSAKKGKYTGSVVFPEEAPRPDMFNFAYCNGIYWLFDLDNRQWYGYQ